MNGRFDLQGTAIGPGITLLEASAGTGKTHTLVGIVLRLLLEGHARSLGSVLVVTFTVAATEELKTRLRTKLQQALAACRGQPVEDRFLQQLGVQHGADGARILLRALAEFDELGVSTIHGFCKRLLEEQAFECGTPFESDFAEDEVPPVHRAAVAAFRSRLREGGALLAAVCTDAEWTPDQLVRDYVLWNRHPGARVLPEAVPLVTAMERVRAALPGAAAAACAPGLDALLEGLDFGGDVKKKPWPWDPAATFTAQLQAACAASAEATLPLLLELAGCRLEKHMKRSSKATIRGGVFAACTELANAVDDAAHSLRTTLLADMRVLVERDKQRQNLMVFQDLLERVHTRLHDEDQGPGLVRAVQDRFAAALIDEFQDTDRLQYEIFRKCFRNRPLFLVGDPKQSIYGFRGGDLRAYLGAQREASQSHTLPDNHRSHPQLVAAVQALFQHGPLPFFEPGIVMPVVQAAKTAAERAITGEDLAPLQWRYLAADEQHKKWPRDLAEAAITRDLCAEVVRLLGSGLRIGDAPLSPSHIAVLTRTNAQAVAVQDGLRASGVHSAIGKAGDIFESDELEEIDRLLLALLQPANLPLVRAAWATRLWGRDAGAIHALDQDVLQERERVQLEHWRRLWHRHGLVVMAEDLLAALRVRERLLARPDGERRLTNYLQVIELLHGAERAYHLTPDGLRLWLQHERLHQEDIDYQRRELRLESDADAVKILTVHGAKGLQYEVVFCPFLQDGRVARPPFHYHDDDGRMVLDLGTGDDTVNQRARAEQLAEDLRLLYVALTRAERRCYVYWGATTNAHRSALGWLLHGPRRVEDADIDQGQDIANANRPEWQAQLETFVAQHGPAMAMQLVGHGGAPGRLAPTRNRATLASVRPLPAALPRARAMLSFTSLALGTRAAVLEPAPEYGDPPLASAQPIAASAGFARGAHAGRCLHSILEHVDLRTVRKTPEDPAVAAVVQRELQRHGLLLPSAHREVADPKAVVHAMLQELASATARTLDLNFGELDPERCQREWQFVLPLGAMRPRELAQVFARAGQGDVARYAERLQGLSPRVIDGFLVGFVDLVAEQDGRWFIVDWKSNHLGADATAYDQAAMQRCMQEHDYVLQYHLYVLALHRLLQQRLRGYDYERHFGGVCYPFLRGVAKGGSTGLFTDRPPLALVQALQQKAEGERR